MSDKVETNPPTFNVTDNPSIGVPMANVITVLPEASATLIPRMFSLQRDLENDLRELRRMINLDQADSIRRDELHMNEVRAIEEVFVEQMVYQRSDFDKAIGQVNEALALDHRGLIDLHSRLVDLQDRQERVESFILAMEGNLLQQLPRLIAETYWYNRFFRWIRSLW